MRDLRNLVANLLVVLLLFSGSGSAEGELSWTLPEEYLVRVQNEINKWDDLGSAYQEISRYPFVGEVMVMGWPQIRIGPVTGKTYFNCARPTTFIFAKRHPAGELRFTLWVHGDDAGRVSAYVKTSDDIVHVVLADGRKIESIETLDTLRKEAIWGPGKEVSIKVSTETRYVWVMPAGQRIAISDVRFIDASSPELAGSRGEPQKIQTFVNEEFNFSFSVPGNWRGEQDPDALLYLKAEDRLSTILIIGQVLSSSKATLDDMIAQVETLTGYEVLKSKKVTIDGEEGIERSYKANSNGVPVKLKVVYLLRGRVAYGIVCGTWDGLFNQLEPEFDRMIAGFKFLDKHGLRQSPSENARFSASGLTMASEFRGKRDYTPRPGAIFFPGEEVNVYTEFSNFKLLESNTTPRYTISIQVELRILAPSGNIIYEERKEYISHPGRVEEAPKYIFINVPYKIPPSASEGLYEVHLTGKDMIGQEEVTLIGRFEVRSR